MEVNINDVVVKNHVEASRFEAQVEDYLAVIDYELTDDKIIFIHTGVPDEIEGHGIAGKMAKVALEYAKTQQLAVVPDCPFVAAYIKRHPEYQPLVAESR